MAILGGCRGICALKPIISTDDPVIILGGGEFAPDVLDEALTIGRRIVAADGGAARAISAGLMPDAVIGDFDSLDEGTRTAIPLERLHRVDEQETTDFEKCLTRVDCPFSLAVGFTGARIDHALAVMRALVAHPERRCIVLGPDDFAFHAPSRLALDLVPGQRVSLFPMRPVTGRSQGLRWPIDGLDLAPWGRIGTSNEASEARVRLSFDGPGMLVILPRDALGATIAVLRH